MGSGPTVDLAARLPRIRAVVLRSPILSGLRVMYPVNRTYWFDIYKNIDKISLIKCPVLIIHEKAEKLEVELQQCHKAQSRLSEQLVVEVAESRALKGCLREKETTIAELEKELNETRDECS
ncbi:hypothetical protein PTKIN_Ptkin04bG0036300 [Pterospermum kingtungense]